MTRSRYLLPLLALVAPSLALASTTTSLVSQIAGLFYIVVGLALVVSILLVAGGFALWCFRLGTYPTHRDEAIRIMEWGVATLFTVVVVLGAVEYVQRHAGVVLYILSIAIILLVVWLAATSFGAEKKEEKEE